MNKIFNYYKKKYKLEADLIFCSLPIGRLGNYNLMSELIIIDKQQIDKDLKSGKYISLSNGKLQSRDKQEIVKFILLHEIKHAIDFRNKYETNANLEKFESRANEWALKRIKNE